MVRQQLVLSTKKHPWYTRVLWKCKVVSLFAFPLAIASSLRIRYCFFLNTRYCIKRPLIWPVRAIFVFLSLEIILYEVPNCKNINLLTRQGLVRSVFCFKLPICFAWLLKNTCGVFFALKQENLPILSRKWVISCTHPLITRPWASPLLQLPTSKTPVWRTAQQTPASIMPTQWQSWHRVMQGTPIFCHVTRNTPLSNSRSWKTQVCAILVPKLK